jgi:hypothetical protein
MRLATLQLAPIAAVHPDGDGGCLCTAAQCSRFEPPGVRPEPCDSIGLPDPG